VIVDVTYLRSDIEVQIDGVFLKKFSKRLFGKYFKDLKEFENEDQVDQWLVEIESKTVQKQAYFLLSYKSYPSHLLLQKLIDVGIRKSIAQKQLDECIKLGYVNDSAFLEHLIKKEKMRGFGSRYIKSKLLSKNFSRQLVEVMLEKGASKDEEKKSIISIYEKLKNKKNERQIYQYLLRKGFEAQLIQENINWQEI